MCGTMVNAQWILAEECWQKSAKRRQKYNFLRTQILAMNWTHTQTNTKQYANIQFKSNVKDNIMHSNVSQTNGRTNAMAGWIFLFSNIHVRILSTIPRKQHLFTWRKYKEQAIRTLHIGKQMVWWHTHVWNDWWKRLVNAQQNQLHLKHSSSEA